ncbi:peptidoglycan editing factor PgeF [Actinomyces israelii]|uniref:peptidoglycan editing factor PgeF n=1 Tax=Actinomyces israelii TaxID=1659 RepID=UPI00255560D4|nr:peptidoglycan editing factor PgeF [Actinomyces israelii]WKR22101.1 Polyphenol oxidase [Actinomyces israelii]
MGPDDLLRVALGPGARGCFTTRGAGAPPVTPADPYAGFNLAAHVGDDPKRVERHRRLLAGALELAADDIGWMAQVHSAVVATARRGRTPTADALVVECRDPWAPRAAGVLVADCVPVLLATDDGALVAAVHAGRRGMLDGVVPRALAAFAARGARAGDVWAAIGPAVCGACYAVPEEMRRAAAEIEPECAATTRWGTPGLDVAAGVRAQLGRAGVTRIAGGPWCTAEDRRFFSYRRDGTTGRIAGIVVTRACQAVTEA